VGMPSRRHCRRHCNWQDDKRRSKTSGGAIDKGELDEDDDEGCLEKIKSQLSKQHANLLRPILMNGAAKDLLNKDAALGFVDKDNSDECFEYIKKNLSVSESEEHASLRWGCHLGGTTTGER